VGQGLDIDFTAIKPGRSNSRQGSTTQRGEAHEEIDSTLALLAFLAVLLALYQAQAANAPRPPRWLLIQNATTSHVYPTATSNMASS